MHLLIALISLGFLAPTPALASEIKPLPYSVENAEIIMRAYAVKYGIYGDTFVETARCESGFNPRAKNPNDPQGGSLGVFQFQPSTFYSYSKLAGIDKPDIWDPMQQIQTAAYMFSIGEERQWTCFRSLAISR